MQFSVLQGLGSVHIGTPQVVQSSWSRVRTSATVSIHPQVSHTFVCTWTGQISPTLSPFLRMQSVTSCQVTVTSPHSLSMSHNPGITDRHSFSSELCTMWHPGKLKGYSRYWSSVGDTLTGIMTESCCDIPKSGPSYTRSNDFSS